MIEGVSFSPATEGDVRGIIAVLLANRDDTSLFQRSRGDVSKHIRDFIVAKDTQDKIIACAALHRYSLNLAEILSVAVLPNMHGKGIGERLIQACIQRAQAQRLDRLWLATMKPNYFARFGYERISRWQLPTRVLLSKLKQVFKQSPNRWIPAIVGRQTFMQYDLRGVKR